MEPSGGHYGPDSTWQCFVMKSHIRDVAAPSGKKIQRRERCEAWIEPWDELECLVNGRAVRISLRKPSLSPHTMYNGQRPQVLEQRWALGIIQGVAPPTASRENLSNPRDCARVRRPSFMAVWIRQVTQGDIGTAQAHRKSSSRIAASKKLKASTCCHEIAISSGGFQVSVWTVHTQRVTNCEGLCPNV